MTSERCSICQYARQHGGWPSGHKGTHCRDCHHSWSGSSQAHCVVCHGQFATNGVGDHHWLHGRHVDPSTVDGLHLGTDGIWSTSPDRDPNALRQRLVHARQSRTSTAPTQSESPANPRAGHKYRSAV
jgi:hypothetical protein